MKIKILALAVAAIAAIGAVTTLNFPRLRFTVHVIGEDSQPIEGVKATFVLNQDSSTLDKTTELDATTDGNGNMTVEGYSQYGTFAYRRSPSKDGYYSSGVDTPPFNHEVKNHEWQPWDATFTTVLRKIGNPIPMYARSMGSDIPAVGVPCGYDLEEGDWVAPYGNGKTTDIIVTLVNRVYNAFQDFDVSAIITFPNDGDGIQEVQLPKEFANSQFKWPREAPETGFQPQLELRNALFPPAQKKSPINTWKENQTYFFRVRTVKQGNQIVSALYGKINSGISLEPRGVKNCDLSFIYYLNPTPNDQNMEWDPKKNLAPTPKDVSQQVREP